MYHYISVVPPEAGSLWLAEAMRMWPARAIVSPGVLVFGTTQHPRTHLWQSWVMLDGLHIEFLSAHRDEARARVDATAFQDALFSGALAADNGAELRARLVSGSVSAPMDVGPAHMERLSRPIQLMSPQ